MLINGMLIKKKHVVRPTIYIRLFAARIVTIKIELALHSFARDASKLGVMIGVTGVWRVPIIENIPYTMYDVRHS